MKRKNGLIARLALLLVLSALMCAGIVFIFADAHPLHASDRGKVAFAERGRISTQRGFLMKDNKVANGRIIKGLGGLYTVRLLDEDGNAQKSEDGYNDVKCRAKGAFRHEGVQPLVGDMVTLELGDGSSGAGKGAKAGAVINEILERKCALIRPPMANLDYLFITMASASPAPLTLVVDKLISIAEYNGIEPIIIITKSELDGATAKELCELYSSAGFETFMISSFDDSFPDVDRLGAFISDNVNKSGKIAAFAGASGVGKSTILNKFFPELKLDTSDVSRKTERGRHTTRHVELYPIDESAESGYIADTPGFSMLDFDHFDFFDKEYLTGTFREFDRYVGACKYKKCTHTKEEGCAILDAVKCGEVAKSRHESYLDMYASLKDKHAW